MLTNNSKPAHTAPHTKMKLGKSKGMEKPLDYSLHHFHPIEGTGESQLPTQVVTIGVLVTSFHMVFALELSLWGDVSICCMILDSCLFFVVLPFPLQDEGSIWNPSNTKNAAWNFKLTEFSHQTLL